MLAQNWSAARRYKGAPPKSMEKYFTKDAQVFFVAHGSMYKGTFELEKLMESYRLSYQYIERTEILHTYYGDDGCTVIEECMLHRIQHSVPMQWLAPDVQPTRRSFDLRVCTVTCLSDDGRISEQRVYWDHAQVMHALRPRRG